METHSPDYIYSGYLNCLIPTDERKKTLDRAIKALKGHKFDAIAFRGMSGALIAPSLANALNKSIIMVRKNDGAHSFLKVEGDKAARSYIIVDDFIDTGKTARTIKREVKKFAPNAKCLGVLEVDVLAGKRFKQWHELTPVPSRNV